MTKFALYSDNHTEFGNSMPEVPSDVEIIILAGDDIVGEGNGELEEFCNENYDKQVVMVAGNHNYYGKDFDEVNRAYLDMKQWAPNLHFLNNGIFEHEDIVIHGCTLWTDFSCKGEIWKTIGMMEASRSIADFHRIKYKGNIITPSDMSNLHRESLRWLSSSLKTHSDKTNVVVTHFPPLVECKHPHIAEGILDTYFNNDLGEFVSEHDIKWWLYGHNHWSDEFELYGTRFLSNQRGYPREKTGFSSHEIYEF